MVNAKSSSNAETILAISNSHVDERWIDDAAATFHIGSSKDLFSTYERYASSGLMGDNHIYQVVGISAVQIKMFDGIVRTLTDVWHIP